MQIQDRTVVRTAADLEKKLKIDFIEKNIEINGQQIVKVENELSNFAEQTIEEIDNLQNQIDGNITTYYYSGVPTLSNLPASEWLPSEYNVHLGDLYYDKDTGYAYRFYLDSETTPQVYGWTKLTDSDVTEALALANAAKDTADGKRRVFVNQPISPYDVGDLWVQGSNGDILRCQTSVSQAGQFNQNHWIIASKYTDDTVADAVIDEMGGTTTTVLHGQVVTIMNNYAKFTDLATGGSTIINGDNITTGTIGAERIQGLNDTITIANEARNKVNKLIPLSESSTNPLELENSGGKTLVNYELEGNIHQETTTGKNLIGGFEYSRTAGGVTFTYNKDGSITCSGTSTSNNVSSMLSGTAVANNYLFTLQAGTYTISGGLNNIKIQIVESDGTVIKTASNYENFTLNTETIIFFRVNIPNTGTSVNTTIYPQLESGSSVTSYEPYTGGIPSPNPDYPQEIEVIDGYNLFDKDNVRVGVSWNLTSNTARAIYQAKVKPNTTYSLQIENIEGFAAVYFYGKTNDTDTTASIGVTEVTNSRTITTNANTNYIGILFNKSNISIDDFVETKIQLVEGTSKTYLPYNNIGLKNIGKNLWNLGNEYTWSANDSTWHFINGTSGAYGSNIGTKTTYKYYCETGKTYIFQFTTTNTFNAVAMVWSDETSQGVQRLHSSSTPDTIVYKVTGKNDYIIPRISIHNMGSVNANITNVMIEEVEESATLQSEYQPYQEIITPIDLQGNFIGKIGDTRDLLRYENGHIYLDKKIGKLVLDGSEVWQTTTGATGYSRFLSTIGSYTTSTTNFVIGINNYFFERTTEAHGEYEYLYLQKSASPSNTLKCYIQSTKFENVNSLKTWLSTHNTEVYYELAEPYTIDLGEYTLPTLEGDSTISLLATLQGNMYCRYIRKTDFNDTYQTIDGMRDYYNKVETDARITIETDNINESVSEIRSLVDENGNNIMSLQQSVTEQITSTQAQFSVINSTLENGVEKVNTGLVLIDINGLRVQKGDSKVLTLMANNTFALVKTPYDSANPEYLAFFGYDETEQTSKAQMDNLTITNYFTAGYHRQEKMTNVENARGEYENRTGWFYAGGV